MFHNEDVIEFYGANLRDFFEINVGFF